MDTEKKERNAKKKETIEEKGKEGGRRLTMRGRSPSKESKERKRGNRN